MLSALGAAAALGIGVPTRPVGARACISMRDRSLEGASSVLGRLAAEAFKRAQSGDASQPIKTKSFTFRTKVTHTRDILGAELVEYMTLPVESFALYDAELMRRIDADTFELRLPVLVVLVVQLGELGHVGERVGALDELRVHIDCAQE